MSKVDRRIKVKRKIRSTIFGTESKPRLTVFKSNKGIYAQLINDDAGVTIMSTSALQVESKGNKTDISKLVGKTLGEKAKSNGIETVVFDRNGYMFHGRVKALAEGAREAGLKF